MKDAIGRYGVDAGARILDVWELFGPQREVVLLSDVTGQLGMVKSTAYRFLRTLEAKGYIERCPEGHGYRKRRKRHLGMLSLTDAIPFVGEVESGIATEALRLGAELQIRHGEFDTARTLSGVDDLLGSGIELLIAYNPDEHLSHVIADRCSRRGVPILAITFPVPGARLFGVNNYRAGLTGGEGLATEIQRRWNGSLDLLVTLDIPGNSPAQQARITGMIDGLRQRLPNLSGRTLQLHIDRRRRTAKDLIADLLENEGSGSMAVLCYNDATAIGAHEAVEEAGRCREVLILSQGGVEAVRSLIARPRSAMWGAVAHFPERFGRELVPIAFRILHGEEVPGTIYTDHALITRKNVRNYATLAG